MSNKSSKNLAKSVERLSLKDTKSGKSQVPSNDVVADSWEDEEQRSGSTSPVGKGGSTSPSDQPSAPPPTPISPTQRQRFDTHVLFSPDGTPLRNTTEVGLNEKSAAAPAARPEKTNATASRMIAGALGVRAPRRTEEQRAYDKALREKEAKRKETEKEAQKKAKEDKEKAIKDMWDG